MPDPCVEKATSALSSLFTLLGKLVWPALVWLLLRKTDINTHLTNLLKTIDRVASVKVPLVEVKLKPEQVDPLPEKEVEAEISTTPTPSS